MRCVKTVSYKFATNDRPLDLFCTLIATLLLLVAAAPVQADTANDAAPKVPAQLKAYCLDFNWAPLDRKFKPFATPGTWSGVDPAKFVAWHKTIGANVIQTFCVSNNGYAWYKSGVVPSQPGLVHDFLPEVVKRGHDEGMLVMGYFCIAANAKWGQDHPDLSYGTPKTYHIPFTDEYLAYLSAEIDDAVRKTRIDGFMIDWVWMPDRGATGGKWLDCEKKLYESLMDETFPGEDKLTRQKITAYSRKAIDRCWKAIRKAAKDANPHCIVWLTSNNITHPHVINSDMYKEADWLMNEVGDKKRIDAIKSMIGTQTRLITCLADWNGQDALKVVPEAMQANIGLYGFAAPRGDDGLINLDRILARPVAELHGDDRNIATLARVYRGASLESVWDGKTNQFVDPAK